MRFNEWVANGKTLTIRHKDPYVNKIIVPVRLRTKAELCSSHTINEIETYALIDTGATISAIDAGVAKELGLIPISKCQVCGVHGAEIVDMYSFNVSMGDLNISIRQATTGQFQASEFKMLIGMDILRLGEMYLGQEEKDGKCVGTLFSFSVPPTGEAIDYTEKIRKERRKRNR